MNIQKTLNSLISKNRVFNSAFPERLKDDNFMKTVSDSGKKLVYEFMLKAAEKIETSFDVLRMIYINNSCGILFVAVSDNINEIYGCNKEENAVSEQPLCQGSLKEIAIYLNTKDNIPEVMRACKHSY